MASLHARRRDPLLDARTQAALERRLREAIGIVLVLAGLAMALVIGSYAAQDPGWMSATDAPAQNLLGRPGAGIASPLVIIAGRGAWGLALAGVVWGLRLVLHRGEEHALGRAVFVPIGVALASVYAATLLPPPDWGHSFGLGGLFGDTVLGAVLGVAPVPAALGLKVASLATGIALLVVWGFVLGVDRHELAGLARFLGAGFYRAVRWSLHAMGATGRGAALGAALGARKLAERRAGRAAAHDLEDPAPVRPTHGILARLPLLARRQAAPLEPELVEPMLPAARRDIDAPSPDRVRARIADAVSARAAPRGEPQSAREEVVVLRRSEPERATVLAARREPAPSRQARAEAEPQLDLGEAQSAYEPPPLSLLAQPEEPKRQHLSVEALEENARMLESVLDDYGVKGEIVSVRPGPVVTMYELEPAPGLKANRVILLADDIARSMSALSARVSTVPGRSVIGIELPNVHREKVVLREILAARDFGDSAMRLPLALGKNIGGEPIIANLSKMPHLLIAGTTGSGKSVAINTMILSLLYRLSPEDCRLIMIDPKMLELSVYDGIPHLLSPVVTDPKKAVVALKWVVGEMEERYRKMSKMGVRNIDGYNGRVAEALAAGEMFKRTVQTGFDEDTGEPVFETDEFMPVRIPYIVVVVDEMADLMMVAGKEIEACIQRLAQMARASGIHLIMATQRPSVDVITGTIKANFPTRISFQVTSKIDSRTILGEQGAEQLLGMGDMLYMAGGAKITRIHGPFVSDEEVEEIVTHLKSFGPPEYTAKVLESPDEDAASEIDLVLGLGTAEGDDALYDQAVAVVVKDRKCSTSYIQRKLAIGYNKAARLVEQMEDAGLVTPANHVGKREILVPES